MNTETQELEEVDSKEIKVIDNSPAAMMIMAKKAGLSAEEMKSMFELQKDWEANEALKAFNLAVSEFRENPPTVYKDKKNKQYDSNYVSIGNMVNTVSADLCKYGLSARWSFSVAENNNITCTCTLSHRLGHSESSTVDGPPDESGKKNALQARKSTRTYLKLESFESVTGMASVEANLDDDGNSAGPAIEYIGNEELGVLRDLLNATDSNEAQFCKVCKVESLEALPLSKYPQARKLLMDKQAKADD